MSTAPEPERAPELEPCGYTAAECAEWRAELAAEADLELEP